jgi:hypothetical protein
MGPYCKHCIRKKNNFIISGRVFEKYEPITETGEIKSFTIWKNLLKEQRRWKSESMYMLRKNLPCFAD